MSCSVSTLGQRSRGPDPTINRHRGPCNFTLNRHLAIEKEDRRDPDSARIEELWKSNRAPSDEAAQEVKRLLLTPLKDLEDLEAEILELKTRLSCFQRKRDETQKRIFRYQSILAPIRRLSPEMLGEIFYHCLPTHRNPIIKLSHCPLLLTRVCSTWRTTAISTPKLWDRIYITFTDEDTVPNLERAAEMAQNGEVMYGWRNANPELVKQLATQLLRRRCEAVKEWLLRSGTRPLSISMTFTSADWYDVPYSERPATTPTMELLSFLASLAPRWKEFDVKTSFSMLMALEDMLPVSQMTTLTSLKAECPSGFLPTPPSGLKLLDAPNLRQISMGYGYSIVWSDTYHFFKPWDRLTHLACAGYFSDEQTRFIFEHATNLVQYQGFLSVYINDKLWDGIISMPFLQNLFIEEYIHPTCLSYILCQLNAPRLQCVKYSSQFRTDDGALVTPTAFSASNPAPIPILPLLRQATELTSLAINAPHSRFWDLRGLLRAVPSVTDLTIGVQDEEYEHPIQPASQYDNSGFLTEDLWSFSDLIVDNSCEDIENGSDTLLPRLTHLSMTCRNVRMNDDTLFDLIKSRLASKNAAALKDVKAVLFRERERNIVEELNTYAESIGVQINLDLEYTQKRPSVSIASSPDFGLSREDE